MNIFPRRQTSILDFTDEHDFVSNDEVAATCETDGIVAYKECSRCHILTDADGEVITESEKVIAKLGHAYQYQKEVSATCTKEGTSAYYSCLRCDKLFDVSDAKNVISAPEVISKLSPA